MKNLLFSLMAIVLFSFNSNSQNINLLNSDKEFQEYVASELKFTSNTNDEALKQLTMEGSINEGNLSVFYRAFNTNANDFVSFTNKQTLTYKNLSEKYKFKSHSEKELNLILQVEVLEVLNVIYSKLPEPCRDVYINDLQINFATAVGAHIACGTADITVVLGIICHGAVAMGHNAANNNAYINYQNCLKK